MANIFHKIKALIAASAVAASAVPAVMSAIPASASYNSGSAVLEKLDRGITAINTGSGMLVSWRFNGTDSESTVFKLYRNDSLIFTSDENMGTSYLDQGGNASSVYRVDTISGGNVVSSDTCSMISNTNYFDIPMDVPAGGSDYTYSPNDCSTGDVDGDGTYELFVKWDPSNSKDNSQSGYTGNVYIDCYTLKGKKLWRIDLGKNIRAGAHYTQHIVADFDGDGKAEMTCKTADGTIDGKGKVIGDASKDYRNSGGYILDGPEYYTLFDGETGAALDTVDYEYPRGEVSKSTWGDNYGNRVDRFLGTAAYLDGVHPSAVSIRGYYTRMTAVAYDVVNKKLVKRWGYDTGYNSSAAGYGNGNHNLMPADVDNDGKQEVILGATCLDDNGQVLWCNKLGHGDAMHLGDLLPDREGLELWVCHEAAPYGVSLLDAKTGNKIFHYDADKDTGRCCADNILASNPGAEFWGARVGNVYSGSGTSISQKIPAMNFLCYWDGDLEREILDGNTISKMTSASSIVTLMTADGCESNNSTKATPNLSADITGDWREEVVLRTSDNKSLRVFTTPYASEYRLPTLMHDSQYRMQVSAQQASYNQPPHLSYYIGSDKELPGKPPINTNGGAEVDTSKIYLIRNKNSGLYLTAESGVSGANVSQSSSTEENSRWTFEDGGNGYYFIKNCAGDVYLDITGDKSVSGTNVEVYMKSGSNAQLFRLQQKDSGYVITTKSTGGSGCIEIINAYTDEGANVQQWEINGHDCQTWILEPIDPDNPSLNLEEIVPGDVNRDGKVNVFDALILSRTASNITGNDRHYADTNSDGDVNGDDIAELCGFLTKKNNLTAAVKKSSFYYAEHQFFSQGIRENLNGGFKGENYVNLDNVVGSFIEWTVSVPEQGNYYFNMQISNGAADNRPMKIQVNGSSDYWNMDFFTTGSWTTWSSNGIVLPLNKGINKVKMTSQTAGGGPNISTLYIEKTDEPVPETAGSQTTQPENPVSERTVYIAGDSTVQTYKESYAPQQGWGAFLQENLSDGTVANHSLAGRSSKKFVDEGRLDTILSTIKANDLLFVQFAINDADYTKEDRYAPTCGSVPGTEGSFEWYMAKFIEGAKAKGAIPVMVTTTIGLKAFDSSSNKFVGSYTNYCDAMKKLASYYQIPCVDLNSLMVSHYNSIGYDNAYQYHMISAVEGSTDMTHFTETGAKAVAKLVADEIKRQGIL